MLLHIIWFLNTIGKSGFNYVEVFAPTILMYCTTGLLTLDKTEFGIDL
jgi:hypothetical protein